MVPVCDRKDILEHATKKTQEVINADLPYVSPDFRVMIETETTFSVERDQLLRANVSSIVIDEDVTDDIKAMEWVANHNSLIEIIDDKISRLPLDDRDKYRDSIIKAYLDGQNMLAELRKYPPTYEAIRKIKSQKERYLTLEIPILSNSNMEILKKSIDNMEEAIRQVPGVESLSHVIAWEAVADWIIRCPLDFPNRV